MLGCGTVQVCTAAMLDSAIGPNIIKRLNAGLDAFLDKHADKWKSVEDFRGSRRDRLVLQSQIRRPEGDAQFCPSPTKGPSKAELIAMRKQFTNPAVFTLYKEPLLIVEGHMQYLYDETGRRYLDLYAGIVTVSVGHCHPKVVKAVKDQVDTLQHATTIYLHPNFPLLAKKLASKMPKGLDVTYFTNSGSEANDLAVMMARLTRATRTSSRCATAITAARRERWVSPP